jgi:signal transduction histidine kinase/DNA-binding response OmpR family regulator
LLQDGSVLNYEATMCRKDATPVTIVSNVTLLRDHSGKPVGSQGLILDVTPQKEMLVRMEQAKMAADAANRAKSAFLATMSHEIRTPMNGIIGMTDLMLDTELTSEQREHLYTVKTCAESLLAVINDVLDFSKIEAGKFELDRSEFTLDELLGDTLRGLSVRAHQTGLELVYHIEPAVPARFIGDSGRLRQVLVNLIGNAIKFTEKGEIVVQVKQERRVEDRVLLLFSVADTGIGIPKEKRADIFDAFAQADNTDARKYGGTGLGLTISSRLVGLFGGRMWVESEQHKGSTFYFTAEFRLASDQTLPEVAKAVASLQGMSALVVDDNATNRKVLQEMLTGWGMDATPAESGRSALVAVRERWQAGKPFELILIDCMMPEMDGFELAERMRADSAVANAKVMMLTPNNALGAAARCRELGLSAYLVKPIRRLELLHTLSKSLAQQPEGEASKARGDIGTGAHRKLHILLAEDNLVNQQLAVRLLTREGHSVDVAINGKEAVHKHAGGDYNVVLMDVQMPEMDGFEATAAIRARDAKEGRRTPIIAMTAHAMLGDRERCLSAGMDAYISKPIDRRELLQAIQFHGIESDRREDGAGSSAEVDYQSLQERCAGDKDLLLEILDTYLAELPKMMKAIRVALADLDAPALHRAAHALKGSTSMFGAKRVCELAQRLETMGRKGELTQAEPELEALGHAASDLTRELSDMRKRSAG